MAFQGKWRLVFKRKATDQDVLVHCPCLSQFRLTSSSETVRRFEDFAKLLARKIAGLEILFHYVFAPEVQLEGSYVVQSTDTGTVILNVGFIGEGWFRKSNWQDHVEALIFLLAQHRVQVMGCDSPQDDDLCFHEELAHLGASALGMAMGMIAQSGSSPTTAGSASRTSTSSSTSGGARPSGSRRGSAWTRDSTRSRPRSRSTMCTRIARRRCSPAAVSSGRSRLRLRRFPCSCRRWGSCDRCPSIRSVRGVAVATGAPWSPKMWGHAVGACRWRSQPR